MHTTLARASSTALLLAGLLAAPALARAAQAPRVDRESMWWAPSAEDWEKPVLITWQRTWDDALAVARESGKPILVCVNMDGEIASEHYAGVRYRQPEIAKLYEPYVCVIASVYRHNPRDYDEEGKRIPCPRFGTVTCGEHIWIEPLLYERFFDERRIAPRHVMVELDGSESYDVYYAFDTDSVFRAIRDGVADRPIPPERGTDRSLEERVASRDVRDREAVERAWREGDRELRRRLLQAALSARDVDEVDLLRLALFGFDVELARLARQALAQADSEKAVDLIADVLRTPLEATERELLIAALDRLGGSWPRAHTLAAVHRGLASRSDTVDVEAWSAALAAAGEREDPAREQYALAAEVERRAETLEARPADAGASLEAADAFLALAAAQDPASKYARVLLEDARGAAQRARELGARGWELEASLAVAAARLGEREEARARAESAMADLTAEATDWKAAEVLALFAEARREAIARAVRAGESWPPEWLTDVHAAYSVLARHPDVNEGHVLAHVDFLRSLGASAQAARVLDEGLERFPDSWLLHDRLRGRILAEKGARGLEPAYEARLARLDAPASAAWYAGYASLVTAEFHRRAAEHEEVRAAYGRALEHYAASNERWPQSRASADHFAAMALAGRARVALERGDLDGALDELLASFARWPDAAASRDGLNLSAVDTARALRARLAEAGRAEQAARLQAALDALDPVLLLPPAFEREPPGAREGVRFPRRRR